MATSPNPQIALADEIATFYADPLGFVLFAFDWGHGELAHEDGPDDWQREFLADLGRMVAERGFDGTAPVDPIRMATASGHGIGKSALTAWVILWLMSTRPHCKGIVTANTSPQLETKTWAELAKWWRRCITKDWFNLSTGRGSMKITAKASPETWRCDAQTCAKENSEAFAGLHAAESTPFYIYDEASAVPDEIWDVSEGGTTDGEPIWLAFGNPTRNTGKFREAFARQRHRWNTRNIDSRTAKKTNKALLDQWVEDYGEDSDFVRVRVRGLFPRAAVEQFIPSDLVEAARAREVRSLPTDPLILGIDVARFGDDQTVFAARRGADARSLEWSTYRGLDTMQVAARAAEWISFNKPQAVFVDEGGIGGGVLDRLRQLGHAAVGVNFGASPDSTVEGLRVANKRAEMWAKMREWLKGEASVPDDVELEQDMIGPEYSFNAKQEILLEKKEDMKKRGLASPDKADALALTFAHSVAPLPLRRDPHRRFGGSEPVSHMAA